jgi:hypothetical protein
MNQAIIGLQPVEKGIVFRIQEEQIHHISFKHGFDVFQQQRSHLLGSQGLAQTR